MSNGDYLVSRELQNEIERLVRENPEFVELREDHDELARKVAGYEKAALRLAWQITLRILVVAATVVATALKLAGVY